MQEQGIVDCLEAGVGREGELISCKVLLGAGLVNMKPT